VLAVHLLWTDDGDELVDDGTPGGFLLWGEDSELPESAPLRRGRKPAHPTPVGHPFAASTSALFSEIAPLGSVHRSALGGTDETTAVLWLPGTANTPEPSPHLIRSDPEPGPRTAATGLWPFEVPALWIRPSAALDLALALATPGSPDLHVGASVPAFAAIAGLALECVAAGRVLPDLRVSDHGYLARWTPLLALDDDRQPNLITSLPPICRALHPDGQAPAEIVHRSLERFVDAVCRDALAAAPGSLLRPARGRPPARAPYRAIPVAEAWLAALSSPSPLVAADAGGLAKLERQVAEWRSGAASGGGPWRLCLRLQEPPTGQFGDDDPAAEPDRAGAANGSGWRVDFLLQATDDLSLLVGASDVWSSGDRLQRASRSLQSPHEVLLAELGRAACAYPELSDALREPAPTGLDLDLDGAHRFLAGAAPALELAGFGILLPAWWRRPQARLGVRLRASSPSASSSSSSSGLLGQDNLCEFDWEAALGDQKLGKTELRRLAKLKAPLVNIRGQWVELRPGEAENLIHFLDSAPKSRRDRTISIGDLLRVAATTGLADGTDGAVPVLEVSSTGWLDSLLRGELENNLDVLPTPTGFIGTLRPYQQRGVAWLRMLERLGLGACLADDMGLGKTATVLALLQAQRAQRAAQPVSEPGGGPTLVICPTSVVGNWAREAERFTPELSVLVHHGAKRERESTFEKQAVATDVVITTYALATRDRATLAKVPWDRIVLDEAQNVKNPETKQAKAVRSLPAPSKIALTGTPVENHLGELWSIMETLNPGLLGTAASFRDRFIIPVERYREEEALEQLRHLTRPFILRRLKTDRSIISDLPEKIEMNLLCNLTREQVTLYQAVVDEMLRRIDESEGIERKGLVLTTMLRLKQVCNHPAQFLGDGSALSGRSGKLERTTEVLDEILSSGERALVFTQFSEMGTLLVQHLSTHLGCRVSFFHGQVSRRQRDAMVEEFQDPDGEVPIMVLSLKAGGTGLNLTAANHVIHFDRWWNPAVENQATDRAFRIGQRRDVQVRKLVCAGTVEDRINALIESKRDLAERVVGAGEGWLTELSTEELSDVFRLSAETLAV
jgi:hypothetical protein